MAAQQRDHVIASLPADMPWDLHPPRVTATAIPSIPLATR